MRRGKLRSIFILLILLLFLSGLAVLLYPHLWGAIVAIDSLKNCVGYQKIALQDGKITKTMPCVQLDASAIAKGFGCDVVATYLESQGVQNYLVDIGGEMRVKGVNMSNQRWRVGIQQPKEDSLLVSNQVAAILSVSDVGVATSGNYRQF